MNHDDLKRRTKRFGLDVIRLVGALPETIVGRTIGGQLARAGPAVSANFRAACRGCSPAGFIAKIGTVGNEADKNANWLELIIGASLLRPNQVQSLLTEANELVAIMAAPRKSAGKSQLANRKSPMK